MGNLTSDSEGGCVVVIGDMLLDNYVTGRMIEAQEQPGVPAFKIIDGDIVAATSAQVGGTVSLGGAGNLVRSLQNLGFRTHWFCEKPMYRSEEERRLVDRLTSQTNMAYLDVGVQLQKISTKLRVIRGDGQLLSRLDSDDVPRVVPSGVGTAFRDQIMERLRVLNSTTALKAIFVSEYHKGYLRAENWMWSLAEFCRVFQIPLFWDPKDSYWMTCADWNWGPCVIKPNTAQFLSDRMPTDAASVRWRDRTSSANESQLRSLAGHLAACFNPQTENPVFWFTAGDLGSVLFAHGRTTLVPADSCLSRQMSGAGDVSLACFAAAYLEAAQPQREGGDLEHRISFLRNCARAAYRGVLMAAKEPIGTLAADAWRTFEHDDAVAWCHYYADAGTRPKLMIDLASVRMRGRKIVFTNGVFDLPHVGHAEFLQQIRHKFPGCFLLVAINSDASMASRREAGYLDDTPHKPVLTADERAGVLRRISGVDGVVAFDELTPCELLAQLRPDVLVKGGDYTVDQVVGREIVEGYGGQVLVVPTDQTLHTSDIINRIAAAPESSAAD